MHALLWLLALSFPHPGSSAEPGYRVIDFDWVDGTRARAVPARLYWPASATPAAPVPLVLFSHGMGGSREGYSYLGTHWSSHGVASLHVQHTGSDAALWRGNPFGVIGRLQDAAHESEAIARAEDMRFALDRILSARTGSHAAAVDRRRIVAAGHSYGANTTLLTIGAQVTREGRTIQFLDPRIAAAVVISAPPFYGETNLAAVMRAVSIPTIHITSTGDEIEIPGYRSGVEDRLAIFDAIADPRKLLAVFDGGSHSMFTDRAYTGGPSLNAQVKRATADLTMAFFDSVFAADHAALAQWQHTWQSILAQPPLAPPTSGVGTTGAHTPTPLPVPRWSSAR